MQREGSRLVALTSLLTAFTLLATVAFTVYIPETRGYFNLGEVGVYISSIILPPAWAAFAAGVGSSLADVMLGYYIYAPATLLIKGAEALVASFLVRRLRGVKVGKAGGILLSIAAPAPLAILGMLFYVGPAEVQLLLGTLATEITVIAWLAAAAALATLLLYLALKGHAAPQTGAALAAGGAIMVAGYFMYQQFILGLAALAEVPFNLMQVLIGMSVSLAVEHRLRRVALS